ncbi:MAG: hypothetical protein AAF607_10635 [Pseudomonadota bacterium]
MDSNCLWNVRNPLWRIRHFVTLQHTLSLMLLQTVLNYDFLEDEDARPRAAFDTCDIVGKKP